MPALGKIKATHNSKYKFSLNGKEKGKKSEPLSRSLDNWA